MYNVGQFERQQIQRLEWVSRMSDPSNLTISSCRFASVILRPCIALRLKQFWKFVRVASSENRNRSIANIPRMARTFAIQKDGILARSVKQYWVTEKEKQLSMKQNRMQAPMEGTRKPITIRQFQFLTLMASFNVTTMITLVQAESSAKQKPDPQPLQPLVLLGAPIAYRVIMRQITPWRTPRENHSKNRSFVNRRFCWLILYILGQQVQRVQLECLPSLSDLRVCLLDCTSTSTSNTALSTTGKKVNTMLQKVMDQESQNDCPEPRLQKLQANWTMVNTMFLQKKQRIISLTRMQLSLPQYNRSFQSKQNSPMAQLETWAARVPSYPKMPTPTWASRIMFTSLAPSPIARVSFFSFLTTLTISAFWLGVTRQKTAEEEMEIISRSYLSWLLNTRVDPSITGHTELLPVAILYRMQMSPSASFLGPSIRNPSYIILQERAMLSAVSSLSPVSMMNLMPAFFREQMVSGTQSCSRSSIPVAPNKFKPSYSSLSLMAVMSALAGSTLQPSQRDLSPVLAISIVFSVTNFWYFWLGPSRVEMVVSAPFTNTSSDLFQFTTTVILFLTESNSISLRISNFSSLSPYSTCVTLFSVFTNSNPIFLAALSRATSSGEGPWYPSPPCSRKHS